MAPHFYPGQAVRPLRPENTPRGSGWYGDEWLFRVSTTAEAKDGIVMRPSLAYRRKTAIHLQVCQYVEVGGILKTQKHFACWQWAEDFEADDDR